jgi:hypothetical protein
MSRRGAAASFGISHVTLHTWLERGRAEPDVEPYGSFAADYLRAERGVERTAGTAVALRTAAILQAQQRVVDFWENRSAEPPPKPERPHVAGADADEWKAYERECELWQLALAAWSTPPPAPAPGDFEWLLRVQVSRYPEDHGATVWRKPEQEPDGAAYLERLGLKHEQLVTMLSDPPETIRDALVAAGDAVYAIMVAGGWRPPLGFTERQDDDVHESSTPPKRHARPDEQQAGSEAQEGPQEAPGAEGATQG